MFFSSVFVPSSSLPAGRTETLASTRRLPSSMLTSETPSWRTVSRRSRAQEAASAARAQIRLGDDLDQRRAAAVEVDQRGAGAVDPPGLADVDHLRRVLLEVGAVDPHLAQPALAEQIGMSYWLIW